MSSRDTTYLKHGFHIFEDVLDHHIWIECESIGYDNREQSINLTRLFGKAFELVMKDLKDKDEHNK